MKRFLIVFLSAFPMTTACGKKSDSSDGPSASTDPVATGRQRTIWNRLVAFDAPTFRVSSSFTYVCASYPEEKCPNSTLAEGEKIVASPDLETAIHHFGDSTFDYTVEGKVGAAPVDVFFTSTDLIKNPQTQYADESDLRTEWLLETVDMAPEKLRIPPGATFASSDGETLLAQLMDPTGLPRTVVVDFTLVGGDVTKTFHVASVPDEKNPNSDPPNLADFPAGELKVTSTRVLGYAGTSQVRDFETEVFSMTVTLND